MLWGANKMTNESTKQKPVNTPKQFTFRELFSKSQKPNDT